MRRGIRWSLSAMLAFMVVAGGETFAQAPKNQRPRAERRAESDKPKPAPDKAPVEGSPDKTEDRPVGRKRGRLGLSDEQRQAAKQRELERREGEKRASEARQKRSKERSAAYEAKRAAAVAEAEKKRAAMKAEAVKLSFDELKAAVQKLKDADKLNHDEFTPDDRMRLRVYSSELAHAEYERLTPEQKETRMKILFFMSSAFGSGFTEEEAARANADTNQSRRDMENSHKRIP